MTLREIADRIRAEGGVPARYFTPPRADGTRRCIFGDEITQVQWFELLRLCRPAYTPEEQARMRAHRAHDAAVGRHT